MEAPDTSSESEPGSSSNRGFQIHHADTRHLKENLRSFFSADEIESGLVDVTITSPPYADKKDYGYDRESQIGLDQPYNEYLEELRNIYGQTYDVTKDRGTLWVVVNTIKKDQRMVRIPFDIADVCENLAGISQCEQCGDCLTKDRETGSLHCDVCSWEYDAIDDSWRLQETIIWDKQRARPWSRKGQFRNTYEYIMCFSKTRDFKFDLESVRIADPDEFKQWWIDYPERYNPRGKVPSNIWDMVTPTQGSWGHDGIDHPAPFPRELVERIIRLTTEDNGVVFDPFAGTGTVLAQAEVMGRRGLGFELSEEYIEAYPDLRDEIAEEWRERHDEGQTLERQQARLEDLICGLRQLKYPRELVRRIRKDQNADSLAEVGIHTAILLSNGVNHDKFDEDHLFIDDDLYLIVENDLSSEKVQSLSDSASKCAAEPPCSKFGISADIEVLTLDEVKSGGKSEWGWPDEGLYLYNDDTQHIYTRKMSFDDWMMEAANPHKWRDKHAKNHYPPILSNLGIEVDRPEDTWRKEREGHASDNGHSVKKGTDTRLSDF